MKYIILLFVLVLFPFYGSTCSCIGKNTLKQELKGSDIVFLGKVIKIQEVLIDDNPNYSDGSHIEYRVSLLVQKTYKGKTNNDTLEVITPNSDGECGIPFQIGLDYIVYAKFNTYSVDKLSIKSLSSNICSRTDTYSLDEENEIMNRISRRIFRKKSGSARTR